MRHALHSFLKHQKPKISYHNIHFTGFKKHLMREKHSSTFENCPNSRLKQFCVQKQVNDDVVNRFKNVGLDKCITINFFKWMKKHRKSQLYHLGTRGTPGKRIGYLKDPLRKPARFVRICAVGDTLNI